MAKAKKKIKAKAQGQPAAKSAVPDLSSDIEEVINNSIMLSSTPPVLMKVCRLCGSKEGPFLNIFDQDQITAIKIDQLMPFKIEENDDLPHKICFRCSAKLEELHEFVSKCIKTQENLHDTMGKRPPVISRTNTRQMWEEKLNKSNLTNDDICDALIKKAMEGIKDLPISPVEDDETIVAPNKEVKTSKPGPKSKKPGPLSKTEKPGPMSMTDVASPLSKDELKKIEEENNVQFKEAKLTLDKCDEPKRSTRSKAAEKPSDSPVERRVRPSREATRPVIQESSSSEDDDIVEVPQPTPQITDLTFDFDEGPHNNKNKKQIEETAKKSESEPPAKPFNIMDHVCMIKVNGVGVLFQCKLCNRNFLKKEVVKTHSCAKNGVPKVDFTKSFPPPEPPKIATVKYINTKVDEKKVAVKDNPPVIPPEVKPKPKIGPASRVKHNNSDSNTSRQSPQPIPPPQVAPVTATPPVVNFSSMPGLNGRFRLVPGPNNSFTLMEDSSSNVRPPAPTPFIPNILPSQPSSNVQPPEQLSTNKEQPKKARKRKSNAPPPPPPPPPLDDKNNRSLLNVSFNIESGNSIAKDKGRSFINVVDDDAGNHSILPDPSGTNSGQPYPVGLFHTLARAPEPPAFTTPAMKKQSYTIVQTGNPSKLLISTKPQAPVEEVPKKRLKKSKGQKKEENGQPPVTQDGQQPKDPGYFTFINVDPLVQTSYILPTDNIIQESQISTSTAVGPAPAVPKDKYSCNMCNETFSREKKLLAHIQSHYSKMDEEDQLRAEKSEPKKRCRKS